MACGTLPFSQYVARSTLTQLLPVQCSSSVFSKPLAPGVVAWASAQVPEHWYSPTVTPGAEAVTPFVIADWVHCAEPPPFVVVVVDGVGVFSQFGEPDFIRWPETLPH